MGHACQSVKKLLCS